MRTRQIRLRFLLIALVLAASVPLALLTASIVHRVWSEYIGQVERRNVETARAISVSVEQEVEGAIAALNVMATLDVFDVWQLTRFQDAALRLAGQRPGWLGLVLLDPQGRVLVHTAYPAAVGRMEMQAWASSVAQNRRAAVSDLLEDAASRQHYVVVAVPVLRNGELQFVLGAQISSTTLDQLLGRQRIPPHAIATLIDREGRTIARSPSLPSSARNPDEAEMGAHAMPMSEGAWRARLGDGRAAYAALSRSSLSAWTVAFAQPAEAIDAPVREAMYLLAAVSLIVLVSTLAIAMLLARTLMRSLGAATAAAEAVARGHGFDARPSVLAELNTLWQGLRSAADILARRLKERDQADAERQRALEAEQRAREAAQSAQGRLVVTLDSIADAVLATDPAGTITMLNRVAQNLTGWPEAEALGRPLEEVFRLVAEQTRAPAESPLARVARDGRIQADAGKLLLDRRNQALPIEYSAATIDARDGRAAGTVLVFRDVSAARTAARMREQLLDHEQRARQDAEQASQSKDEFVAMISHELRAPLNAIYGWVQLLQAGTLDAAQQKRAIEIIERSTRTQTQLIDDLLDMSRIIRGSLRLEMAPTELVPVLQGAVESVRPQANAKKVEIAMSGGGPAKVFGDIGRLQQIFANLLINAIKFTPQGGRIDATVSREGDEVLVRIADNGLGIEPEALPYIFEPFRQASAGVKRARGSLGIGLALVRHLVQKHGGNVVAESAGAGQGTVFTVRFPSFERTEASALAQAGEPSGGG